MVSSVDDYNLSPMLCMKRKYMLLSMMISNPRQPGKDIDIYLKLLIDDLKINVSESESSFAR